MWGSLKTYTHTCLHNVLIILDIQCNNINNDKEKKYMQWPKDLNCTNNDIYNPNTQSRLMPFQNPPAIYIVGKD